MSRSHSLPLSPLSPSFSLAPISLSFMIYHWGDEFEISIIELLNIDGSSKSLTRSRQGRGNQPPTFAGPSFAAAQPSRGIQPGQEVTVTDHNLLTSMRSFNVLPRLFSLTSALIIHYHMQKKNVKKLSNYALCRAAFIHCSRCVNYNESTGVWFDMIIEIFNWVSADLLCVRTDHCWKEKVPPGHRRAKQHSDGSIFYTIKSRWDFFYYFCCQSKLQQPIKRYVLWDAIITSYKRRPTK